MTQTATPSVPTLLAGEDTGRSASDGITDIKMPTLVGQAAAGATVTIHDTDDSVLGTGIANTSGYYSIVLSQALNEGGHLITATASAAGESESLHSVSLPLTEDSMAPDAPAAPILVAADDTGFSAQDGITSKTILQFTGLAEPNSLVQLYNVDNSNSSNILTSTVLASGIAASDGSYTLTTATLPDGSYKFEVTATDVAGNVAAISKDTAFTAVTIDSVAPATPAAPTLDTASDTGLLHSDGLTDITTPVITGTAEAGATVELFDGNVMVGKAMVNDSGAYAITAAKLADGAHALSVKSVDAAGNSSAASAALNIVVDTAAPSASSTPDAADAIFGSVPFQLDFSEPVTGLSLSALQLIGTGTATGEVTQITGSGSDYTVLVDGLSGAGTLRLALTPGNQVTDEAGNAAQLTTSNEYAYTDQNTPFSVQVGTYSFNGTSGQIGLSGGGRLVSFDTDVAETPNDTNPNPDLYVKDMRTGGITLISAGVDGSVHNGVSGYSSLSANGSVIAFVSTATGLVPNGPTDGLPNVYVAQLSTTNVAEGQAVSIKNIQLVSTGNEQDGIFTPSASENFYSLGNSAAPVVSADGTHIVFSSDKALIAGVTPGTSNIYEYDIATGELTLISDGADNSGGNGNSFGASVSGDGTMIVYTSDATNLGGAVSPAPTSYENVYLYNVTTNTTTLLNAAGLLNLNGPNASIESYGAQINSLGNWVTYTIQLANDTAFIVNQNVAGTDPNAGKLEQLTPSTLFSFDIDPTVSMGGRYVAYGLNILGNGATPPDQVGLTDALTNSAIDIGTGSEPFLSSDGNAVAYTNESYAISDGVTTNLGGQIVLTTLGPTVGIDQVDGDGELDEAAWQQALKSGLVVTGVTDASAGASVRLQLLNGNGAVLSTGQTTLTTDGVWSVTLAAADLAALADGTYRLNAIASASDGASFPTNRFITVDTQAPAPPAAPVLDAGSDSSAAGDGSATNQDMPSLTGAAEAGATITLYDNSGISPTLIGTAVADDNGAYAITPTAALKDGMHSLDVTATDEAGNVSAASPDVIFKVDTVAPAQPTLVLAPASDTGASNSDGVTKNASPTVTGIGEAGTSITLYDTDGLAVLGTTKVKADGTWSLDSSNPTDSVSSLADGVHSLTVTDTDAAGNVSPRSAPLTLTIDTTPPFAPTISSVNGVLVDGALAPLVTVSGTAAPGTTVTLRFDGGNDVLGTTTAAADGDYSLESDPLPAGAHMLSVVSTDLAGNDSQQSLQTAVTITDSATPPPGTPPNSPTLVAQLTDGPIAGATVFADANGNGVQDAGEAASTTNTAGLVTLYNAGGELIATGGIDTVTGLTPIGALTAPAGSTAITPLTTLLDAYATAVGQTPQAAQPALLTALGLASTADLTQLTPEALAAGGDLTFLIASASVMDTAVNFADLIAAQTGASQSAAFAAVFTALAEQAASGTLDLVSTSTMQTVLTNAAALAVPGAVLPQSILQAGAAIAQTGNYDVSTAATPRNGVTSQGFIDAIERVEQGEAAPQYAAAANDPSSSSNVVGLYTYDLGDQVTSAEAPVLAAPVLASSADTGASDQDNITALTNPVFTGTAPPGATVILVSGTFHYGGTTTIVGSGVADSTGRYAIAASLSEGANTLIAMQAAASAPIANGTAVSIPATLTAAQLTSVVVGVLPEVTDIPLIEQAYYVADSADTATQTSLYVSGKGAFFAEGASFTLTADNNPVPIGTAQVETGLFGIVTTPLSNGTHSLVVTETALDGETLQSLPFTVTVTSPGSLTFEAEATGPVAGGFIVPFDAAQPVLPTYDETVHPAGTTDAAGTATIPGVVGVPDQSGDSSFPVNQADSGIELVGGQDTLTGLPLPVDLGAPVGASVIDPATTLLNQAENDAESIFHPLTPAGAAFENGRIDTALGLNTNINLLTADPLAMAEAGDPTLLLKNIELLDTVALLSPFGDLPFAVIDNAEGKAQFSSFVNGVPPAIVAPPIDFTNAASILGWLTAYYAANNPALLTAYDASVLPVAAEIIAASNAAIEAHAKTASSLADTLSYALAVERVAIGDEAPAFVLAAQQAVGSSPSYQPVTVQDAQFAALQAAYTGTGLTAAIASALAQTVQVTNLAPDAATTNAASATFDLSFSAPVTGLTTGDFAVSGTAGLLGPAVTSVTPVEGSDGKAFTVTVATGVGQGTLTLAFTPTGIAGADGLFATAQTYASPVENAEMSVDDRVNGLAVGDFNGDGKPDIVATLEDGLTLFRGLGDGSFVAAPSIYPGGVNEASQILTGDFNGDGKLDVAVLTDAATDLFGANPDYAVSVLRGNGNGSFQSPVLTDVGPDVVAIATSDFNGDGKPDIAVLSQPQRGDGDAVIQLYDGNGDGTFTAGPALDAGGASGVRGSVAGIFAAPQSLVAADLNGDGKPDLVVATVTQTASGAQYSVNVLLNGGGGSFGAAASIALGLSESSDLSSPDPGGVLIAVADVNGDGIPDIVAVPANQSSLYDNAATTPTASVLLGKGNGTFQPAINVTLPLPLYDGSQNQSIAIGDVTGDGVPDLVIQNSAYGEIVVPGNGDGTFGAAYTTGSVSEEPVNSEIGNSLPGLALADVNGDGRLDLITGSTGSAAGNSVGSGIAVALNTAQTVLPASAAVTVSRPAAAQPMLTVASGAGTLTNIGNAYTLNLGTLVQGAAPSVVLALANTAAAPADSFDGQFSTPSGSGFTVTGATLAQAVIAGGSYAGLTFTADTSLLGNHSETIIFAPRDESATVTSYTTLAGSDEVQATMNFVDGADVAGELAPLTLVITDDVTAIACFATGTRILTPQGEFAVEALAAGDEVVTQSGAPARITWIGHRRVDCRNHPQPQSVWPVRILADAFAPGMPHCALFLSPDHAVFADGILIPVKFLINGTTVMQEPRDEVTYWHVELAQHDVLMAEGLRCETYLDTDQRRCFANGGGVVQMHVDFFRLGEDHYEAVWEAAACAPLRIAGPGVQRVVSRLAWRARALGFAQSRHNPAAPRVTLTSDLAKLVQPAWYLTINPDVAAAGVDATAHYIKDGRSEGRLPCPELDLLRASGLIDPGHLVFTMQDVIAAGADPVEHFCTNGWRERRSPNMYFDTAWYLETHDVPAGMNPLLHYLLRGENEGLAPSRHFDPAWYRGRYGIGHTESPLAHYLMHRRTQRFSPLAAFDVAAYRRAHAATMRPGRDPYAHFLAAGECAGLPEDQTLMPAA